MKRYTTLLFVLIAILSNSLQATTKEVPTAKDVKVLVLIIASDGVPAYLELQKIWKSYMHKDPDHFEVYFIRGNPDLPTSYEFRGDDLYVKTEENYQPGITNKTVLSLEALMPRMKEFDYVLRTNLSSFYVFPRLLEFVGSLPRQKCYCGYQQHIPKGWLPEFGVINFISGAGILLSSDLAEMLVQHKQDFLQHSTELPDDVLFGYFFQNNHINSLPAPRMDFPTKELWLQQKGNIPKTAFHFRAKNNYNKRAQEDAFADELFIDQELLKMFYSQT